MAHLTRTNRGDFLLEDEVVIHRPLSAVFEFFSDPRNLGRITPPWLRFKFRDMRPPGLGVGTVIDYQLRLHGFPVRWRSVIPVWQPPRCFVDRQVTGPYQEWIHEHLFDPVSGGTRIRDRVRFRPPGGRLAVRWWIGPELQRIFAFRKDALRGILEPGERAGAA
jgi:ligand-binding SRPBCC domain-containing protein